MDSKQAWFAVLYFSICLLFCIASSSTDTITSTDFISDAENQTLLSSNGFYKLGFFSPPNSFNRYVGIWFNKIPVQNIVWVANRDTPLKNNDGVFKISDDGRIVIYSGQNQAQPIWSSNITSFVTNGNRTVKLLASGNMVLVDKNGLDHKETVVWQSFDYPTDTILAGMKLGVDRRTGLNGLITSWKSASDPGTGDFSLALDTTGSPQFYVQMASTRIWRAGPWNGHIMVGVPKASRLNPVDVYKEAALFNYSYVNNNDEVYITFGVLNFEVFRRLKLETIGIAQQQIWDDESKEWSVIWVAPQDRCDKYNRCGPYTVCNNTNAIQCLCLPGYTSQKYQEWGMNCVEKRKELHLCGRGEGEGFIKMGGVKIPDASKARFIANVSLQGCELECLKNCSCTGYASADVNVGHRGCFVWHGELIDVRTFVEDGQDLYIRVDAQELEETMKQNLKGGHGKQKKTMLIIILIVVGSGVLLFIYWWRKRAAKKALQQKKRYLEMMLADSVADLSNELSDANSYGDNNNMELTFFPLDTILRATDNFSPFLKLGQGGFGPVYKGDLSNGQEIAVKRLLNISNRRISEFKNEALLIAKLQHRNLVRLLGCCIDGEEKMLIYEYMPNQSLDYFIFDETRKSLLGWKKRYEIILGVARGILYLHQDSRLKVIHRDVKTGNILLDRDLNPKISDFGTARLFGGNQSRANTCTVVGTFGYMSPEYILHGLFSEKSDVYSFGIVLLEIICGKKNSGVVSACPPLNLIGYVWAQWTYGNAIDVIDTSVANSYPANEVLRCIQVGLLCVQDNSQDRPTMSSVVFMLSNEVALPLPTQPVFAMYQTHSNMESFTNETGSSSKNELTITNLQGR